MLPQRNKKFMLHIILAAISPFCRGKGWQKVGLQKKKKQEQIIILQTQFDRQTVSLITLQIHTENKWCGRTIVVIFDAKAN